MERDDRGRFKKKEELADGELVGLLEKAPSTKVVIVLFLVIWILLSFCPTFPHEKMRTYVCTQICFDPPPGGSGPTASNTKDGPNGTKGL